MSLDRPEEELIFDQAIQIADRQARSEFLDRSCQGDTALRGSLEELLACHDTAGDYLETAPIRKLERLRHESVGDRVDRYQLVECIGEGGFGVVYRAQMLDPIQRDVAIKIIRLGMDSEEVVRRFESERQVMSIMNHPHIASVLDAGTADSGRPYFVMEFVNGAAIDRFCDGHRLSICQILTLFIDVCQAIQHAHQKGVVHRDLKPSNVIVVAGENRPTPKVIDFGIAKALWPVADKHWFQTAEHRILGTPGYMSPEQIARDVDIDTRADVYALGGILYKLVVGVEPFDPQHLRRIDMADAYRQMRDDPAPRPSARWASLGPQQQQQLASLRNMHPSVLGRTLKGDLDWIMMRALEKDRDRRYSTVHELVADVRRFLDHKPVAAGPPSMAYRLRKLVRRNRIATLASILIFASLASGGVLATIGMVRAKHESRRATDEWRRAEQQRQLAVTEADKADQSLSLLEKMLGASHPGQGHAVDYTMRQLLDDFADSFEADLARQPDVAARLHRTVGKAYWSLGEMPRAGQHLERALELYSSQFGDHHPLTAETSVDYALYLLRLSRVVEAWQTVQRALPVLQEHPANEQTVWALFVLSRVHHEFADDAKAFEYVVRSRDVANQVLGPQHPVSISMRMRALFHESNDGDADQASLAALNDLLQVRPAFSMDVADAKRQRSVVLLRLGRCEEAESLVREAIDVHQKLLGPDTSHLAHDMLVLTRVLQQSGRGEEAIQQARQTLELADRVTIERDILRHQAYESLASLLESGSPGEAIDIWTKAISAKQQVVGKHVEVAKLLHRQAGLYVRLGELPEAAECYRRSLQTIRESPAWEIGGGSSIRKNRDNVERVFFLAALDLVGILLELEKTPDAQLVCDEIRLCSRRRRVRFRPKCRRNRHGTDALGQRGRDFRKTRHRLRTGEAGSCVSVSHSGPRDSGPGRNTDTTERV